MDNRYTLDDYSDKTVNEAITDTPGDQLQPETQDTNDSPKVLKRDENETWVIGTSAIEDNLEAMRDELRDKGWPDGAELEAMVAEQRPQLMEELRRNMEGDFSQPYQPPVFPEYTGDHNVDNDVHDNTADIAPINDVNRWLGEVNPNYDEFDPKSPYCNNCGSCAYAVYQRLEGNPDVCASEHNIGYNDEMTTLTGMDQVSMTPDEIEQRLLAQGNGAHAIIGIDRAEGAGHWFNAACIDGRVVAIDGQTGEVHDWPPDYGDVVNWEMSIKQ